GLWRAGAAIGGTTGPASGRTHPRATGVDGATDRVTGVRAVSLCGTLHGVAPSGRYPASCPLELGLSSCARPKALARDDPDPIVAASMARSRAAGQGATGLAARRAKKPGGTASLPVSCGD